MHLTTLHGLDLDRVLHHAHTPVLLIVTRIGCGACRGVKAALERVAPAPGDVLEVLVAYEIDASDAPALVDELDIYHLPALWLCVGGEPVAEVPAETRPDRLEAALRAALAALPEAADPSLQQFTTNFDA